VINRLDDDPGFEWELNWLDDAGEDWSEEKVDDDDLLDSLRALLEET
jgi:hypothetical protein